ncbi:MAG TPA: chromate transporter [Candidatus Dormibacteraeota bacterium]|nr:chromate transporter [Candidatus Dormibacteraeota bacterium]
MSQLLQQLRTWTGIGLQSFGGGQATQLLIYRTFVERQRLMTPAEYAQAWGMCQLPPGINLLALSVLIGWRSAGGAGSAVALAGLVLPSAAVTVLLTVAYALVSHLHVAALALRGVTAGVAGLGLVMAVRLARPPLRASRVEGRLSLMASVAVLLGSLAAQVFWRPPVFVVLLGAGVASTLLGWSRRLLSGA